MAFERALPSKPSLRCRTGLTVNRISRPGQRSVISSISRNHFSEISSTVSRLRLNSEAGCLWQFPTIRLLSDKEYTQAVPKVTQRCRPQLMAAMKSVADVLKRLASSAAESAENDESSIHECHIPSASNSCRWVALSQQESADMRIILRIDSGLYNAPNGLTAFQRCSRMRLAMLAAKQEPIRAIGRDGSRRRHEGLSGVSSVRNFICRNSTICGFFFVASGL